jgi:hypothetical protein
MEAAGGEGKKGGDTPAGRRVVTGMGGGRPNVSCHPLLVGSIAMLFQLSASEACLLRPRVESVAWLGPWEGVRGIRSPGGAKVGNGPIRSTR